jgi:hypothetical protein
MKRKVFLTGLLAIIAILWLSGCETNVNDSHDTGYKPVPPQGLLAVAQDRQVYLTWYKNYETSISGYNIYVSNAFNGKYTKIGFTSSNEFYDKGVTNGTTYYYAVTAYDISGYESDFSTDNSFATPRPELFNVTIYDYKTNPGVGGYNLAANTIVPYNDKNCDIYFENYNGIYYMNVLTDSDIQDMGYTGNFDEIIKSPSKGWSPTKDVQLIVGHTYVVWTFDNHFAKFRVTDIQNDRVKFDCSFQLQVNNPYLKRTNIKH